MGPSGAAAVAVGLWVLVTVGVAADPEVVEPPRRLLSHYRSLDPRALLAIKALRDRYEEETLSWRPRNCSFRRRRDPPRPSSRALLRQVARGLADAQDVLSSLPSPELFPGVGPTLELLAAAGRDVAACIRASVCGWEGEGRSHLGGEARFPAACIDLPFSLQLELVRPGSRRKSLRRPGRRPQTRTAGSPRCHEATVIFNLLRLLAWDLRLVAHSGPCL
ncbi:interferon lambda-4 [Balaenoptera acutorostrata]|uniref:Interferon lambda-4 n=1 Tax=Balaenoptera acutorostrata TaxID=9767 RepID=A0ABM3SIM9_BALAC|nr:interferon lambda-4 [Balaenoptera acutorostrata]